MKCYQIVGTDIVSGLPVVYGAGRPHVVIGEKTAVLSNALIESNPGARLLDCDIEAADGGQIVLVPSKGASDYVLVSYLLTNSPTHLKSRLSGPTAGIIAISSELTSHYPYIGSRYGEGVLVRMAPGCKVAVESTSWPPKPKPAGWRGLLAKQEYLQVTTPVDFLQMTAESKLVVTALPKAG